MGSISKRLKLRTLYAVSALAMVAGVHTAHAQDTRAFNIEAQPLGQALFEYSRQADIVVTVPAGLTNGKTAPAITGEMAPEQALDKLLYNSGLSVRRTGESGFILTKTAMLQEARQDTPFRVAQVLEESDEALETVRDRRGGEDIGRRDEIIVTGTSIRGATPDSSPVDIYTREDIEAFGVISLDQFAERIPQNLNSVTSNAGFANSSEPNVRQRNAIDLRGLGANSTLTLLNGRRLGPSGGSVIDVSLLPLGIIDRVEILTDGASAIYGSDAVAGVVNFITLDEYEGAETSVSFSTVSDSGREVGSVSQTLGRNWSSGNVVGAFSYFNASQLEGSDRDFINIDPIYIAPLDQRYNGFLSINQDLSASLSAFVDVLYSDRSTKTLASRNNEDRTDVSDNDSQQLVINGGLEYQISESLFVDLVASYADITGMRNFTVFRDGAEPAVRETDEEASYLELTGKVSGELFALPAGGIDFAIGAGYMDDRRKLITTVGTPVSPDTDLNRETVYAFGEVIVPLISEENDVPLIHRLEVNASGRYTGIENIGDSFDPKIGFVWELFEDLRFRGTYSESFRAANLSELAGGVNDYAVLPISSFGAPDPFSDDNSSVYLFVFGRFNSSLAAESSKNTTIGFDYTPSTLPGLDISATYYDITYEDRIREVSPGGGAALFDPVTFADLFSTDVTADSVASVIDNANFLFDFTGMLTDPSDPAEIASIATVILDSRVRNISSSEVRGVDFSINYDGTLKAFDFNLGGSASYMIDFDDVVTSGSNTIEVVDTLLNPVDLRFRTFAGLARDGWSGQVAVNYVDSYENVVSLDQDEIDSWTTIDLRLAYDFGNERSGIANGVRMSFNVQNLFNEEPPFVAVPAFAGEGLVNDIGFDPANANPFGRILTFNLTKAW